VLERRQSWPPVSWSIRFATPRFFAVVASEKFPTTIIRLFLQPLSQPDLKMKADFKAAELVF